ncbi:28197_t:CDS:1, partial [Gigaspora margarita]
GQHMSTNISIHHESAVIHLNLSRTIRDQVILSRHADGYTAKEIKLKLLTPFNGVSREQLKQQKKHRINLCSKQKIQQLLEQNN